MTTYHVKISGNDVSGDGSEGNPWRTIGYGRTQLTAGGASYDSSPDELLVWRDPSTPYTETLVPAATGLKIIAVDENGVRADQGGWSRAPVIVDSAGAVVDALASGPWEHWRGFWFDGGGTATQDGIQAQELWLEDSRVSGFAQLGINSPSASSFLDRVVVHDCGGFAIDSGAIANIVHRCVLIYDCGNGLKCWGNGSVVEHVTVVNTTLANTFGGIDVRSGTVTVRNCVVVDCACDYGMRNPSGGGTVERCVSFSSGGSFHPLGDYENPTGTAFIHNSDSDPKLDDDFLPDPTGSAHQNGLKVAGLTKDVDGKTFADPPSRGALESIGKGFDSADEDRTIVWSSDFSGQPVSSLADYEPMALNRTALLSAAGAALQSDRRVSPDEEGAPRGWGADLRGWWADVIHGIKFGSRSWLLDRALRTDESATRAEEYARESMDWLLEQQIATSVDAEASLDDSRVRVELEANRDETGDEELRFESSWGEIYGS